MHVNRDVNLFTESTNGAKPRHTISARACARRENLSIPFQKDRMPYTHSFCIFVTAPFDECLNWKFVENEWVCVCVSSSSFTVFVPASPSTLVSTFNYTCVCVQCIIHSSLTFKTFKYKCNAMRCDAMLRMSNASMQIVFMLKMSHSHVPCNHRLKVIARDRELE